ncbi:sodium/solute symporter [Pirellulales bacterium]|nr:sodium/solute symporter [Pirellulales bacterium]
MIGQKLTLADWAVIAAYLLGMMIVGAYYSRRSRNTDDYLLGGRDMKPWAVGLSLFATLLSTLSYLSWPGEVVKHGPMVLAMLTAYPFIFLVVGWLLIPRIMRFRVTSAYEILETRLGLGVRMLGVLFFLAMRLAWMAVIIYATVDKVLIPLAGLDRSANLYLSALLGFITVAYTSMGGLRAVVFTDVVQTIVLFAGALLSVGLITFHLDGVSGWWPQRWDPQWDEAKFFAAEGRTFFGAALSMFVWSVCTAGSDQMAIQRYLATRDAASARRMYGISLLAPIAILLLLGALGFALLAYFKSFPEMLAANQSIEGNADQLFPRFILVGLPTGISGLVVAGLLAAAMSSLSSGVNSSCSVIAVDFVDRFRRHQLSDADHLKLAKIISWFVGLVVVLLTLRVSMVEGNLLEVVFKVVNLLTTPLFGLFFMAMFVAWATPLGTIVGAVAGVVVVSLINYWEEMTGAKGVSFLWAMPLSILAQILVGMLASLVPLGPRAKPLSTIVERQS